MVFHQKFSGNQLRSFSYKRKHEECYLVPNAFLLSVPSIKQTADEDVDVQCTKSSPPQTVNKSNALTNPVEDTQLAFYVNLHRAVIGPSATLTGR